MAYLQNRIGPYKFFSIDGEPDETAQLLSIDSWPGVDGLEFTDEGRKGVPFFVITTTDCDNLLMADVTARSYQDLQGQGSQVMVRDGELLVDLFKVLKVTRLKRNTITTAVGNKQSAEAKALLICRWDLVAVR